MRGRNESDDSVDRWSRSDWWGVVLDAPDGRALGHFYADLLGWQIDKESDEGCGLGPTNGVAYLATQTLGAEIAELQPQDNVRVMLDPAGHPFCLYTGSGGD